MIFENQFHDSVSIIHQQTASENIKAFSTQMTVLKYITEKNKYKTKLDRKNQCYLLWLLTHYDNYAYFCFGLLQELLQYKKLVLVGRTLQ